MLIVAFSVIVFCEARCPEGEDGGDAGALLRERYKKRFSGAKVSNSIPEGSFVIFGHSDLRPVSYQPHGVCDDGYR